jgi:hypothetical protein
MHDITRARYVQLKRDQGQYVIVLFDEDRKEIGHGYRGPTVKRAEADLTYWTRDKGLTQIEI